MLTKRSVNDLIPNPPQGTILLPDPDTLTPREREVINLLDSTVLEWWSDWADSQTRYPWHPHSSRFIFVNPVNTDKRYDGDKFADVFWSLREAVKTNRLHNVDPMQLMMIGLPGRSDPEKRRALEDLERWYSQAGDAASLVVYREE